MNEEIILKILSEDNCTVDKDNYNKSSLYPILVKFIEQAKQEEREQIIEEINKCFWVDDFDNEILNKICKKLKKLKTNK